MLKPKERILSMKTIKIKAPFYGAGSPSQYNWVKDGYDIFGIGVKLDDINKEDLLKIEVSGQTFVVKTSDIKDFVRKYNSIYNVRNSLVRLGVFSISILKGLRGNEKIYCCQSLKTFGTHAKECPTMIKEEDPQGTLF